MRMYIACCIHSMNIDIITFLHSLVIGSLKGKKSSKKTIPEGSFFRTQSPFLAGSRRIIQPAEEDPVQFTMVTSPNGMNPAEGRESASVNLSPTLSPSNISTELPGGVEPVASAVVPAALRNGIIVTDLTVTWKMKNEDTVKEEKKTEKVEEDKEVLKNVSFEVSQV